MDTRVVTARIPLSLADRVDEYADQMHKSRDWIIRHALVDWVGWQDKKHRMTLEALAAVEAGWFVDDAQVEAWIESLDTDNPLPPPTPA